MNMPFSIRFHGHHNKYIENTRGETSNGEKQNSSNHNWKKHANELPETKRSSGNAQSDRSSEGFV